eukprot:gene9100-10072_t
MANFGKVSPEHPSQTEIELERIREDDDPDEVQAGPSQMFDDLPSRESRSAMSFRRGKSYIRHNMSNNDMNSGAMEMIDLEDSSQDPLAESRNIDKIRAMPVPLAERRSVRDLHHRKTVASKRGLSCWKALKLKLGMKWALFTSRTKEFFYNLELWRGHVKEIEGNFGNGVLSYFLFLKSLFLLNIIIFVLVFSFLTVPQIAAQYDIFAAVTPNITVNATVAPSLNSTNSSSTGMTTATKKSTTDEILDFFTGQGYINTTVMFYSNYASANLKSKDNILYNMPLAYMLVGGSYFIVSLLLLVMNFSQGFSESIIDSGGLFYSYCNKIFASWDYCITNKKAADLKKKNIHQDLEAELAEAKRRDRVRNRTRMKKCQIYSLRIFVSLMVLGLLGGSVYAIYLSVGVSMEYTAGSAFIDVLRRWASSLTITALNLTLPLIFEVLTELEDWSPRVEVAMKLWRAVLLKLASVAVLVIVLYTKFSSHACDQCWENQIGAQMYNLILVDFFVIVGTTVIAETSRKYIALYLNCGCKIGEKIGMQEFQIPKNVLDLIYGQALIWIGTFFCPLIPVIGIIKLFIVFYVKKISLMFNCKQSTKPYQGARSNYIFTLVLLLTFLLCVVGVGWGITRISPSSCGPYSNTGCSSTARMFDIISTTLKEWPKWLNEIVNFIETPAFIAPLVIIILLMLYYFRSMTTAHEQMIDMLKDQLTMEGRDKRYLMERLLVLTKKAENDVEGATPSHLSPK